jgi:O-antigen ligase
VAVFYAVLYFLRDAQYSQKLFYVIAAAALLAAGYGLTQFNVTNGQAVKAFFSSEVWFTTFLVMLFPFAFAFACGKAPREMKAIAVLACCLFFVCLLSTQSRAGLVAFVMELGAMAWLLRSRTARIVAAAVTVLLIAALVIAVKVDFGKETDAMRDARASLPIQTRITSFIHRVDIWAFTVAEIVRHGAVGIGYGSHSYLLTYGEDTELVAEGHQPVKRAGTHNIFLYFALHVGLPGLVLFGWLYYTFVVTMFREYGMATDWFSRGMLAGSTGSLLGLLCRLQFDQMLVGSLAILFWVLLAMAALQSPSFRTDRTSSFA